MATYGCIALDRLGVLTYVHPRGIFSVSVLDLFSDDVFFWHLLDVHERALSVWLVNAVFFAHVGYYI